ncbi:MAG: LD-carboxypeptidase [Sinomicrobium sp.]|nr:LD-carboxypeptidase [Sinomicrobium sp.]
MMAPRILLALFFAAFGLKSASLTAQDHSANAPLSMNTTRLRPPYLKAGDTVAIVATSGVLNNEEENIKRATELLNGWGLQVVPGPHLFSRNGHFAGTDEERAADFQHALDDPGIKAIWCARGGYGAVRILDRLDYTRFKQHPKWIIGYSDITAIHSQVHNLGYESIQAMMCTSLDRDPETSKAAVATFKDAIFGKPLTYTVEGCEYNRTGKSSGQLVGGNLTLLHTMLGSKTSIDTRGKILFIEEIGEYAYHIDRMLQSLKRAGYFDGCKGLIVGNISRVRENTTPFGRTVEELILDVVADYDFPVLFNFPAGHEDDNRALILGRTIELKIKKDKAKVRFVN